MAIRTIQWEPIVHLGPHDDPFKMRELLLTKEAQALGVTNAYPMGENDINGCKMFLEGRPWMDLEKILEFVNRNYEKFEEIV